MSEAISKEGEDKLWMFFGLSYASWLTIPRVLLHEMPDEWQGRLADLLKEYEDAFPAQPDVGTRVQVTDLSGNLIKTPEWMLNYRRPDREVIKKMRGES